MYIVNDTHIVYLLNDASNTFQAPEGVAEGGLEGVRCWEIVSYLVPNTARKHDPQQRHLLNPNSHLGFEPESTSMGQK